MKWLVPVLVLSLPAFADLAPPPPAEPAAKPAVEAPPAPAAEVAPAPAPAPVAAPPAPAEHPGGNQNAPGMQNMGVIEGGWAYVYAAWGAAIFGVLLYAVSLFVRKSETPPPGAP